MRRLTITLSEARYRALKQAPAQRGKAMSQLNNESLDAYGIKSRDGAQGLVARAREGSKLNQAQAVALAHEQTKVVRRRP